MHLSSLKSHLKNPIREGYVHKLGIVKVPMDTNQRTSSKWDPCAFSFFGNDVAPLMATLNILGLNAGLPV